MDGLSAPAPAEPAPTPVAQATAPPAVPPQQLAIAKRQVLVLGAGIYGLYLAWCAGLASLLPSPTGELKSLVSIGLLSLLVGGLSIAGAFMLAFARISKSHASVQLRQRGLIKAVVIALPGLLVSGAVAYLITQEPALTMDIIQPTRAEDLVAPVPVTFSVKNATDVLRRLGKRPVKYVWDTDGDGKPNEETVIPTITVVMERPGNYTVAARIVLDDQSFRRAARRVLIPQAVFSMAPTQPVVENPVRFSIAHLLTDPKVLNEVQWDFGDGTKIETTKTTDILHTYYAVGEYKATAQLLLSNNTQATFTRSVLVSEAPPLPFPVTLTTDPKNLIGPAPFGALFQVETQEPVKEVSWNFGDDKEERGATLFRVGHSYDRPGIYPVVTRIRNASGALAEITTIIRVTETLSLPDLSFQGEPGVAPNGTIEGEAPLHIRLTPKTSVPLVSFLWESADDLALINGETVEAVYRKEGNYVLVLIAQNAEGKVMRMTVKVRVKPPSAQPTILVKPDGGVAPLRLMFDASQSFIPEGDKVAGFKWAFGDEAFGASESELGAARVEHTYMNPGDYTVTLKVLLASGKEFTATRKIVVRKPTLRACLTTSRLRVTAGKGVEFDSACTAGAPSSILWDVRYVPQPDVVVAQSALKQYVHVFENTGEYSVTLTVSDQFGNSDTKSVTITVTP